MSKSDGGWGISRRPGGGTNRRPLTKIEILRAQRHSQSAMEAARWLGCSYETYRKYAILYGVHEQHINQGGRGIARPNVKGKRHSLMDIIAGKYPNYDTRRLKKRLVIAGYLDEQCSLCDFKERRITDYKIPLILNYKTMEIENPFALDNLMLLCYNCTFLTVGNLNNLNPFKVKRLAERLDDEAYKGDDADISDEVLQKILEEARQELDETGNHLG